LGYIRVIDEVFGIMANQRWSARALDARDRELRPIKLAAGAREGEGGFVFCQLG
jgi:hypothetical protein